MPTSDAVSEFSQRVHDVRRFNRFYTRHIGLLQSHYLRSPFSLAEVRVLYELAHQDRTTAAELARQLELDPGYLSRILRGFGRRGLLEREPVQHDGRQTWLHLSSAGRSIFDPLEARAREQIGDLMAGLGEPQQRQLVQAMRTIESLLGQPAPRSGPVVLRSHRPGDMGWVVQKHGELYAREYDFNAEFEALVATIVAKFLEHFDPRREACWIAERDGEPVGCIFLVNASPRIGKLRLFLVDPAARGSGIGSILVDECVRFARAAGYRRVRLWTQSILLAARRIYARAGFEKIEEEPNHAFGHDLISETWELPL